MDFYMWFWALLVHFIRMEWPIEATEIIKYKEHRVGRQGTLLCKEINIGNL